MLEMISVKVLVDWFPAGRHFRSLCCSPPDHSKLDETGDLDLRAKSQSDSWYIRVKNGLYEELYFSGHMMIWSSFSETCNRFPKVALTTETAIIDTFWASFLLPSTFSSESFSTKLRAPGRIQEGVAVFEADRLSFLDNEGERYTVRLPCRLAAAWPMETLVLLERDILSGEAATSTQGPIHPMRSSSTSGCPFTLFSLSHPLDEAAPVLLKIPLPSGNFGVCFGCDVLLKIVSVIATLDLVLTVHCSTGLHSLWKMEKAVPEDYVNLYEVNDEGRACVAPTALNRFVSRPSGSTAEKHVNNASRTFATPAAKQTTILGSAHNQLDLTPTVRSPSTRHTRLCLSPFAASLSQLVDINGPTDPSGKSDFSRTFTASPIPPRARDSIDLQAHINRLSNLASVRPTNSSGSLAGSLFYDTHRPSLSFVPSKPTPTRLHSKWASQSLLHCGSTPTLFRASGASSRTRVPDASTTTSGAPSIFDPNTFDEPLDEPLLPKICLRLVWTESPNAPAQCKLKRVRLGSNVDNDQETTMIHRTTFSPVPGSTPKHVAISNMNILREMAHLTVSSRSKTANRRFLDLSIESKAISPLVDHSTKFSCFDPPRSVTTDVYDPTNVVTSPNSARKSTGKRCAFLAYDLANIPWICYLTTSSDTSATFSRLACLCAKQFTGSAKPAKSPSSLVFSSLLCDQLLTYINALDAVYVPSSRLTACLDAHSGIVLYTGIEKVCILGVSPPPVLSAFTAVANDQFSKQQWMERTPKHPVRTPFIIRPSSSTLDLMDRGDVSRILDGIQSMVRQVLEQAPSSAGSQNYQHIGASSSKSNSASGVILPLGIEPPMPSETIAPGLLPSGSCSLCDAAGNSFTLCLDDAISGSNSAQTGGLDSARRFCRVYLPDLSENEMVQRCLAALQLSLPQEVCRSLLARWYTYINAPGSLVMSASEDTNLSPATGFSGPTEWVRFACFILQSCGLSVLCPTAESDGLPGGLSEELAPLNISDSPHRNVKRHRATTPDSLDSAWNTFSQLIGDAISDPSLFSVSRNLQNSRSGLIEPRLVDVARTTRSDPWSRSVWFHLPTILVSFHLVYEEAKLNRILLSQLPYLAELNMLLSRILCVQAYISYYAEQWPSLFEVDGHLSSPFEAVPSWPTSLPSHYAPCLLTWAVEMLQSPTNSKSHSTHPYVHLAGVNDLATTLAGMLLTALHTQHTTADIENPTTLLQWWRSDISELDRPSCAMSAIGTDPLVGNAGDPTPITDSNDAAHPDSKEPFSFAFVHTLKMAGSIRTVGEAFSSSTSPESPNLSSVYLGSPHNLAFMYLSHVDQFTSATHLPFSQRLDSLPPGFSSLLQFMLGRSCANPPPNCTPHVYSLMGREDLARHAEILPIDQCMIFESSDGASSEPLSACDRSRRNGMIPVIPMSFRPPSQRCFTQSSWSVAERWTNSIRGFRDPEVYIGEHQSRGLLPTRHIFLHQLENNPAFQVYFKDDLRLREAYRLLQATSHIRLPRLNSINPETDPDSGRGSRFVECRLEMHLAAAGIRVWASSIGRGMLGLATLLGARVPTQLRVPPICLRGCAASPGNGQRVLVDLARESLPSPIGTTTATGAAANTAGTGATAAAGAMGIGAGRVAAGAIDVAGALIADTGVGDRRIPVATSMGADLNAIGTADASNHPGNAMALAIASAVAVSGAGAALKSVALDLPRMVRSGKVLAQVLGMTSATSVTLTSGLLSTTNLPQTPTVLAAKHWPEFHNGVAVGLTVAPNASIDATWIMYNCRLAGSNSTESRSNTAGPSNASTSDVPTPEQAGLLLGLGLNGHLNKLTPHDIAKYSVRVHDLHNMAMLLGLCAGKRGQMDQSVLRLLALHYRPLLPSDPLVQVQLAVPTLCQAAAVFGLGLLYERSAHRHITNLLLTELGRPLSGPVFCGIGRKAFQPDGDALPSTSTTSGNANSGTFGDWSGAIGSGGMAGDSSELIALSAGLALGLVLLGRGDSPCGLSDIPWAAQLHAYMTGAPRFTQLPVLEFSGRSRSGIAGERCFHDLVASDPIAHRPESYRSTVGVPHCPATVGNGTTDMSEDGLLERNARPDSAWLTNSVRLRELLFLDDGLSTLETDNRMDNDFTFSPNESSIRNGGPSGDRSNPVLVGSTIPTSVADRSDFTGRPIDRRLRPELGGFTVVSNNPQIRELNCYNLDVSAPGAIMALGMAYFGSGSPLITSWLAPPTSLVHLDLIRPDLLLFRALSHALVNWDTIVPTSEWIQSYCPPELLERLSHIAETKGMTIPTILDEFTEHAQSDVMLPEWSSEDDVENRCPDLIALPRHSGARHHTRTTNLSSNNMPPPQTHRTRRSTASSRRQPTQSFVSRGFRSANTQLEAVRRAKLTRDALRWQEPSFSASANQIDEHALCLAYLNILIGRSFALGLRYAGTCNAGAANTLLSVLHSILLDSWWPPTKDPQHSHGAGPSRLHLPKPTLETAAAYCLLSLAMVMAGSGNLVVLRLIRQLRAIRMFRAKDAETESAATNWPPVSNDGNSPNSLLAACAQFTANPRLHYLALLAARQIVFQQTGSESNASSGLPNGPVSVSAVFGAALGPTFGVQMLYGCAAGLLFLGGGRLTLSNSPQAAAILTIAFLPILPTYPGDNCYHLQALRHLYVLATRPRRLCAVDVDTGRVVLSDMLAKLRGKDDYVSSKDTAIFPVNQLDDLDWLEMNHGSEDYWPTVFLNGTINWSQLKCALQETGYFYVKKKDQTEEAHLLQYWLSPECLDNCLSDLQLLLQLKLVVSFLRRFPNRPEPVSTATKPTPYSISPSLSSVLAARVTEQFVLRKCDVSECVREHYLPSLQPNQRKCTWLVDAFRLWFSLPDCQTLWPYLNKVEPGCSLAQFVKTVRPGCPNTTSGSGLFWLYSFLFLSS
ncbi:unnamed protein product [Dicrocoelium dendriticum]|nr:unnamed protein product [Dicrocoelium dendriticum]